MGRDPGRGAGSRPTSSRRETRSPAAASPAKEGGFDFRAKEEQLRRLDAELNAKKATIVRDAEERLKQQQMLLAQKNTHAAEVSASPRAQSYKKTAAREEEEDQGKEDRPPIEDDQGSYIEEDEDEAEPAEQNVEAPVDVGRQARITEALRSSMEEDEEAIGNMSAAATIRYQKAKMKVLEKGLEELSTENRQYEKRLNAMTAGSKKHEAEVNKLRAKASHLNVENEKNKKAAAEAEARLKGLEAELVKYKRDVAGGSREKKKADAERTAVDVRLNRAMNEVERYKKLWTDAKDQQKDSSGASKKEVHRLRSDLQRLSTQKTELLAAFKKQMKLVDVLKRQKMHVEAARMLAFTEEEFAKTLEVGDM